MGHTWSDGINGQVLRSPRYGNFRHSPNIFRKPNHIDGRGAVTGAICGIREQDVLRSKVDHCNPRTEAGANSGPFGRECYLSQLFFDVTRTFKKKKKKKFG